MGRAITPAEKEQKKLLIKTHALKLFSENNYYGTTMAQIAKSAGISTGSCYRYYAGKSVLYSDLYREALDILSGIFDDALTIPTHDARSSITAMVYSYFRFYTDYHPYYLVLSRAFLGKEEFVNWDDSLSQKGIDILHKLEMPIKQGIEKGELQPCDTFRTVTALWTMFDGVLMLKEKTHIDILGEQFKQYYQCGLNIILNGILAKP